MQFTHSSLENPFSFVIQEKESNNQYSIVGLIKDAFTTEESQDIFNHLQTLEFRKGETSFGAIPRDQIWFNKCGEEFGKRAGWKNSDNLRWKSCPMDSDLENICQQVQTKFNSYRLHNIPGVNASRFDSILANKYVGGRSSIKPHRDSEEVFGNNPTVMILSVGCPREIIFKRIIYNPEKLKSIKIDKEYIGCSEFRITLPAGSLLFMGGETQKYYSHEIQKLTHSSESETEQTNNIRYSLTFRQYSF